MATIVRSLPFRFDAIQHLYLDLTTGEEFPHITGMLLRSGWVDDTWFTEESSARGTAIHRLTADYDLGALDPATCVSAHRGSLLGYVKIRSMLPALEILAVEEPIVHPLLRFGGRPDRIVRLAGLVGVLEIKSGGPERSHQVQTALQAILAAVEAGIPPELLARWAVYLKPNGRGKLEEHRQRADYDEAYRVIRRCCGA